MPPSKIKPSRYATTHRGTPKTSGMPSKNDDAWRDGQTNKQNALQIDKDLYKSQCKTYNNMLVSAKESHFQSKIDDADPKQLFRVVDYLTHVSAPPSFPEHTSSDKLANNFAEFFRIKIERIRDKLKISIVDDISVPSPPNPTQASFSEFRPVLEDEIMNIIRQSNSSTCSLDPMPTRLLKKCTTVLTPVITKIIKLSLQSGHVPISLKRSIMTPRLKKPSLSASDFNNFRPISNLSTIGKVLERAVVLQLQEYLESHK